MGKILFRDLYLIGISFIAGVLFIVQCGGSTRSIAEAVMDAVGIDYSNNESGLQATNMQAAVDEVVVSVREALSYVPLVYDNNGNVIGELMQLYDNGATIWDAKLKATVLLDMLTGEFVAPYFLARSVAVFFTETACVGTPYFLLNTPDEALSQFSTLVAKIGISTRHRREVSMGIVGDVVDLS